MERGQPLRRVEKKIVPVWNSHPVGAPPPGPPHSLNELLSSEDGKKRGPCHGPQVSAPTGTVH